MGARQFGLLTRDGMRYVLTYEKIIGLAQIFCFRDSVGMDFLHRCSESNCYPQPDPLQQRRAV